MVERKMRSDATRNRAAVLAAADRLFSESASGSVVSMDDVAEAAGVGKGTLFRGFGDRAGLVQAVFDARIEALREAVASGPEPLGPGTPPRERIHAIMEAIVRAKLANRQLVLALEDSATGRATGSLFESTPYRWIHGILVDVVGQVSPVVDRGWAAHILLAMTRADLLDHVVGTEGMPEAQLLANVRVFVERVLGERQD
ncbi:TetR family transcriptional regulator [Acrocarpospora pleiomorpha]|uniref:TetR family transcriptional regulator n=3 Tax=Acrocarpospora pleiomorpha TaxID=90975 RepID=A0A5M3X7V0_9ACTN|nr:TetR family transcriptional regulator [Acrocarpospora pleiomorpha]